MQHSWKVEGLERTALVAGPKPGSTRGVAPPVVLVFHGHGGGSAQASRSFGIHAAWPEAVVIYPQGVPTVGRLTDPEGRLPGWQHRPGENNDRDLKFVDVILAWVERTYGLSPSRTFAAGHSNGGSMVYVLWAARADRFAAFAPSSSVFRQDMSARATPKPAFIVAGRKDPLVLFSAQERSLQSVLRLNHASPTGQPDGRGTVRHVSNANADVVTYIHSGGHQLPDDAGALMIRFFRTFAQ